MRIYINTLKQIEQELGNFDVSQVFGGSNDVYLRFGYWESVDCGKLQQIIGGNINVVEDIYEDDDCGYLYSYKLKQ